MKVKESKPAKKGYIKTVTMPSDVFNFDSIFRVRGDRHHLFTPASNKNRANMAKVISLDRDITKVVHMHQLISIQMMTRGKAREIFDSLHVWMNSGTVSAVTALMNALDENNRMNLKNHDGLLIGYYRYLLKFMEDDLDKKTE